MIADLIKLQREYKDSIDPDTQEPVDVALLTAIIQDADVPDSEKEDLLKDTVSMITGELK